MNFPEQLSGSAADFDVNVGIERPLFTVFTPTFNRGDKLHRAFESLLAQDCDHRLFEWVVVDDGSTDQTQARLAELARRADFALSYRYQPNRGKHIAMNRGVRMARGELFVVCDSADGFDANALGYFRDWWTKLPAADRTRFSGLSVRCRDQHGNITTSPVPRSPMISNNVEVVIVHGQQGDAWGVVRTDVIRQFPFPEDYVGSHYPDMIAWNQMARRYDALYTNDVLYTMYLDTNNSITRNELASNDAKRFAKMLRWAADTLNHDFKYFFRNPGYFIKRGLLYNYARSSGLCQPLAADQRLNAGASAWCALLYPFSFVTNAICRKRGY